MTRSQILAAAGLLLLCLFASSASAEDKPAAPAAAAAAPKISKIIDSAGETQLPNGVGDVALDGACKADAAAFCKDVTPGEGRVAMCLTRRIKQAQQGNVAGRMVRPKCEEQVSAYKLERSKHINKDPALARACKDDAAKFCKSVSDSSTPGSVLICLRGNQKKLTTQCKGEILRTQAEIAEDWRLDPQLYSACSASADKLCRDAEPGTEVDCLLASSKSLDWACLGHVVRVEKEAAGDIRLNMKLFRACVNDQKKFCKGVEPGHMRVQECLEDSMDKAGFSGGCKAALEEVMQMRAGHWAAGCCEEDLQTVCSTSVEKMEKSGEEKDRAMTCLQQFKEELHSDACRDKVHRKMQRMSRDIRFDDVLADACQADRKSYCPDVQPGSARVIRCLQDHRTSLSQTCAAALFDHEVKMAEDIDFKYPTRKACAWEISNFCKNTPHGHARVIRCLQARLDDEDMSPECKAEVVRDQNRMAQDYRLNWRLKTACKADIGLLCDGLCNDKEGQMCGGVVLQCLQDKQDNVTSPACQEEVFYYQLMEVTDFRNDVILAEACRADVDKYCKDVEPGEGRVHTCLRHNTNFLSPACAAEESKLQALEYRDIRLKPKLAKVCSEERAVYCKNVKPGKARVISCLMEAMAQPNFGAECRTELQQRQKAVKNDYRYDIGVMTGCRRDIDEYCAEEKTKLRGNATVLRCLVENFEKTGDSCQNEMSRAVRFALWDYQTGQALTRECDADVDAFCPKGAKARPGGMFTIGAVGRCLSKALVQAKSLAPKCRQLVLAAAPKDSRVYLQYPESTSALIQKVAELQRAAGMESVLVDPYRRDGGNVTVTGWVALACIVSLILVSVGGMVMLVRRMTGVDKPHTHYVKSGDA
ncbi:hypothetical protein COO60DRAFT_1470052 [Scenedesmus sp. NREL 46B-D3]|nr:hypothetical protein COO60DRAFT_1470052 [Scenedesmus sp. NREL 46B-D3]